MSLKRAIVLIGVQQAEGLPPLQAVWDGVKGMAAWAKTQGIEDGLIVSITDENGRIVAPHDIQKEVKTLTERGDLDQLIIYYSGHGINVGFNEFWMLSEAMDDGNMAVNLKASSEAATFGMIPHVVFISDSCRSAAVGIAEQIKKGVSIYPGKFVPGRERAVDIFYATLLGDPSMEIQDPNEAANHYQAVYTTLLLESLSGQYSKIVTNVDGDHVVQPRPLKKHLIRALPFRVVELLGVANGRSQEPDAHIASDDDAVLATVDLSPVDDGGPDLSTLEANLPAGLGKALIDAEELALVPEMVTREAIQVDLTSASGKLSNRLSGSRPAPNPARDYYIQESDRFEQEVGNLAAVHGPGHYELGSGFKLRGATIKEGIAPGIPTDLLDDPSLLRLDVSHQGAASVLMELTNGYAVLVPAIHEFVCALTFDGHVLVDVAYEPCDTSWRWHEFAGRAKELRHLRAVVAASTRLGKFRLEGDDAQQLARKMQLAKGIDPSLALYAALAYRYQGNRKRIHEMANYMRGDVGIGLFDIALLAGELSGPQPALKATTFPFVPMFASSWSSLSVYDVELPFDVGELWSHVHPNSLWTVFRPESVPILKQIIQSGDVK